MFIKGEFYMSYEVFRRKVNALIDRANGKSTDGISVDFSTESGKHTARCSDGTTIIGNESGSRVTVRWGSGHQSIAAI